MNLPVSAGAVRKLLGEIEASARREHVLALGGAKGLALALRRRLLRDGADAAAIRVGDPKGATAYVHVLAAEPSGEDAAVLRRARRARVPVVVIAAGPVADDVSIPYVLATDVVRVAAGEGFPLEPVAQRLAARLGEDGAPLAARVPALREAVCQCLVASFARKNGLLAAAVWIPGADLPVLALNQLRLVLRIAQAYGVEDVRERMPELVATVGAGFGLRAAARELLDLLPVAGWLVKGGVAYAGTRAVGEAARRAALFARGGSRDLRSRELG
jgi:uncharacterized protein (DUF697 family)